MDGRQSRFLGRYQTLSSRYHERLYRRAQSKMEWLYFSLIFWVDFIDKFRLINQNGGNWSNTKEGIIKLIFLVCWMICCFVDSIDQTFFFCLFPQLFFWVFWMFCCFVDSIDQNFCFYQLFIFRSNSTYLNRFCQIWLWRFHLYLGLILIFSATT